LQHYESSPGSCETSEEAIRRPNTNGGKKNLIKDIQIDKHSGQLDAVVLDEIFEELIVPAS
jgi:hypothetical protein